MFRAFNGFLHYLDLMLMTGVAEVRFHVEDMIQGRRQGDTDEGMIHEVHRVVAIEIVALGTVWQRKSPSECKLQWKVTKTEIEITKLALFVADDSHTRGLTVATNLHR